MIVQTESTSQKTEIKEKTHLINGEVIKTKTKTTTENGKITVEIYINEKLGNLVKSQPKDSSSLFSILS